jgi:hypothetical protein
MRRSDGYCTLQDDAHAASKPPRQASGNGEILREPLHGPQEVGDCWSIIDNFERTLMFTRDAIVVSFLYTNACEEFRRLLFHLIHDTVHNVYIMIKQ